MTALQIRPALPVCFVINFDPSIFSAYDLASSALFKQVQAGQLWLRIANFHSVHDTHVLMR